MDGVQREGCLAGNRGCDEILLDDDAVQRWRSEVRSGYLEFRCLPRSRLAWATLIAAARPFPVDEEPSGWATEASRIFKAEWKKRVKAKLPGLRWRGVMEFEWLHPSLLRGRTHKIQLLEDLGVRFDALGIHHRVLLPHFHAVVDLGGYALEQVADELRVPFPGRRRVLLKPIWDVGSVEENLSKLAEYSAKMKCRYSEFHPEKSTKFGPVYEPEWKRGLARIVGGLWA